MTPAKSSPAAGATPVRPRRRRWLRRLAVLIVLVLVVLLAAAIAVPLILQSGLPRRLVLEGVARETGLWIEADDVDATLAGVTTLRGVRLGVPLDDEPLLTADTLTVHHTSLLALTLQRRLVIASMRFDGARIDLRERPGGAWNLDRAAKVIVLARAASGEEAGRSFTIPRILMLGSTVRVARASGEAVELPLALDGAPGPAGGWGFEASLGANVIRGHIAPAGWMHAIEVDAADIEPLARLWLPDAPSPLLLAGRWEGDMLAGSLSASITIDHAIAGPARASGDLSLTTDRESGVITATPGRITLSGVAEDETILLRGGRIAWTGTHLTGEDVLLEGLGAAAELDGSWNFLAGLGVLDADFSGRDDMIGLHHRGRAHVAIGRIYGGLNAVNIELESEGELGPRRWDGALRLAANGREWDQLSGKVEATRLVMSGVGPDRTFSGLSAQWSMSQSLIMLAGLTLPGSPATIATGEYDLTDQRWLLSVEADEWVIPGEDAEPIAFSLEASGLGIDVDVSHAWVQNDQATIFGTGSYRRARPEPVAFTGELRTTFKGWPVSQQGHGEHAGDELDDGRAPPAPRGTVSASVELAGTLAPRALNGIGRVRAEGVPLGHGVLDPIDVAIQASADEQSMTVDVEPFELLGGTWTLAAAQPHGTPDGTLRLSLQQGSIERVAQLLAPAITIAGSVDAELAALLPGMDPDLATLDGRWTVRDAISGDISVPEGGGSITVRRGRVRLGDLDLRHGDAAAASGEVSFDAIDPTSLEVALRTRAWPVGLRDTPLAFLVDSTLDATIDLTGLGAQGYAEVDAAVTFAGSVEGGLSARADFAGLTVSMRDIHAQGLGGTVSGSAVVNLDEWTQSQADLAARGIDLSGLAKHAAYLGDIGGVVEGRIVAGPSTDTRALEPLTWTIDLAATSGAIRSLSFDGIYLAGFAGPRRFVLDEARMGVAGGDLAAWARLSWHGDEPFLHVNAAGRDIDLEQIVHAFAPEYERAAGLVGFDVAFGGYLYHKHRAFGDLRADVRQSDLATLPVASQLFSILNLGGGGERDGEGVALARLEEDTLIVEGLRYANRGSELVGAGRVENVWLGLDSPVSASVAAAVNPLEEGILPLSRELGRAFLAATEQTASMEITGTLRNMQTEVVALERVSQTLGRLLGTR